MSLAYCKTQPLAGPLVTVWNTERFLYLAVKQRLSTVIRILEPASDLTELLGERDELLPEVRG